jgi:hypothetical protein
MSLPDTPHYRGLTFKLSPILNNLDHEKTVTAYLVSGHLQNGIIQLNLESDDRLNTLITFLKRSFKRGIGLIMSKASGQEQVGGIYSAKEDKLVVDVANMLDLAVGKYMSEHPEELQNVEARRRHRNIATKIFVEIFYEVCTGSDGGLTTAFLSKELRALAAQIPKEEPVSEETQKRLDVLRVEFEALLKKKDNQIHKLKAQISPIEQLLGQIKRAEVSLNKLSSDNRTLLARSQEQRKENEELKLKIEESAVDTSRFQLARNRIFLKEAHSEIEELKALLAREKAKNTSEAKKSPSSPSVST